MRKIKKTSSPVRRPVILVSNDDGFQAEGLASLVGRLRTVGRVVVVAPDRQQSASSHSLTLHRPLRILPVGDDTYAIDGTPTDCITLGVHAILKRKPDLVVSGINGGANLGDDVHYSGTVSAAVEAALLGIPAVAISLVAWGDDRRCYGTAAAFARRVCRFLLTRDLPPAMILNINVPNLPYPKVRGIAFTRLGKRKYGEVLFEKIDPRGKKYFWISGEEKSFQDIRGSDCNAILERKVSVTPLRIDLTDHALLAEISSWRF